MNEPLHTTIDHLVVGCHDLESGVGYIYSRLGVLPQAGGIHQQMGTHNSLLKLGDLLYLEVVAVNPEAPNPGRPHPCRQLPESGCNLNRLEGFHPQADKINQSLSQVGWEGPFRALNTGADQNSYLAAIIETPKGVIELKSST